MSGLHKAVPQKGEIVANVGLSERSLRNWLKHFKEEDGVKLLSTKPWPVRSKKTSVPTYCAQKGVLSSCVLRTVKCHPPQLTVGPLRLQVVQLASLLRVTVYNQLTWKQHVTTTVRSVAYRLYMLCRLKSLGMYLSFILPKLMYISPAWSSSLSSTQQQELKNVQKRVCRVILGHTHRVV
ncbi:hypothetical protein E2C01_093586 [Portunus trituberculatus]|uniref:Uncharacterized protein n=1 Tax=Portunus trituberculatus TaxID=210409 RepID=A0A5B7JYM6_PORTR|nr:hypothetical protein [Portunus trituberculatus]